MGLTQNTVTNIGSAYDMPSGREWYVCNRSGVTNGDGTSRLTPFLSLADAITAVQPSTGVPTQGDTIYVMAGHAENITASNVFSASLANTGAVVIPAGTRIIGEGLATNRPTFTWTATASALALAAAGCTIENCNLNVSPDSGTVTVTAAIAITANGCHVRGNLIRCSASSTSLCTTAIQMSSAASDSVIRDNVAYTVTGAPTTIISTTGTIGPARVTITGNVMQVILTATTSGVLSVVANSGTAPADWVVLNNIFSNKKASSTIAVIGVSGWTGIFDGNRLGIATTGAGSAITTVGSLNYGSNLGTSIGLYGIQVGTTST